MFVWNLKKISWKSRCMKVRILFTKGFQFNVSTVIYFWKSHTKNRLFQSLKMVNITLFPIMKAKKKFIHEFLSIFTYRRFDKCFDYSVGWKIFSIFRKPITNNYKIWSPKLVLVYHHNFQNKIFNFRSLWRVSVATMFIIVGSRKLTSVDDIRPSPTPPKIWPKYF